MGYLDYKKNMLDSSSPGSNFDSDSTANNNLDFSSAFKTAPSQTTAAMSSPMSQSQGIDVASTAAAGATGAAAGGPVGAGIMVGGSLLSGYLSQKAGDERARREREAAIAKGHGDDQQQAINQIMQNNARALR
jgi:hypothetical protein